LKTYKSCGGKNRITLDSALAGDKW